MKRFILLISCLILFVPFLAYGQSDIYSVKTPNVMIIFDTSNSMEQQPNGLGQGAGVATGIDGKSYNFEGRGNHPNSKLYQAKQALSTIIKNVVQDRVNLGFATYAQIKSPDHMWGYYTQQYRYHYAATSRVDQWRKLYYGFCWTYDSWSTTVFTKDSFTDQWGALHTGVSVGYTFTHAKTLQNSPNNNGTWPPPNPPGTFTKDLKYTVTSINYNGEYNWYTFSYQSDWYEYYWEWNEYQNLKQGSTCPGGSDPDNKFQCDNTKGSSKNDFKQSMSGGCGTVYTYFHGDPGFNDPRSASEWDCSCITVSAGNPESYSGTSTQGTWSDRGVRADCEASVAATNGAAWGSLWGTGTSWYEVTPWTLSAGNCYAWADYYYPSDGSNNKPPSWSYFKIDTSKGTWAQNKQTPNYYPSVDSGGNVNNIAGTFDNHTFFVNFPDDKAAGFNSSVRTGITNQILSYLDLTPVLSKFGSGTYYTTLPMHALYGKTGLTANEIQNTNPYTNPPAQLTPLADSLSWANTYFKDYIYNYNGGDTASQSFIGTTPCRGNYIILLTDGLESARLDKKTGLPDYNAAVVEAANLLKINVKTFVVGFGTDIVGNQTLNNIANAGGTQQAYFAADLNQLQSALQVIFQSIASQFYGRSNPVITAARDRLFRGSFEIKNGDYWGHLMAWNADPQTGVLAPQLAWDSGDIMNTSGSRTLYTYTDTGLEPAIKVFQASESSLYSLVNPQSKDINLDGKVDNADAQTVIGFTLDPSYNDGIHGAGYYKGNRPLSSDWKLGDIYHSTPVVIGAPAFSFTDNNYQGFYNTYQNRETMIYVGTNDGFLHGFSNTDGSEKFAIIPKCVLGNLQNLSVAHAFYVDGSPKAYDVYFKAESKWKTVVLSGLRDGGPYYFAVDVTDPSNPPNILWEWTDPNMGNAWGKPTIGRVKVGTDTKYVAFITGGYSTTDNQGNSFYIVDMETGTTLKSWTQSNGNPVGSSTNKVPTGSTAYDSDADGFVNYVYFGDTSGTIWKVDVSSTDTVNWKPPYDFWEDEPSKRLPIYYAPAVAANDAGNILVFFGTGDEQNLPDANKFYSLYEITDQGTTGKQTWTKNLDPGEKVLDTPVVANGVVYFTTWIYSTDSCGAGEGRLYGLKITKVGAPGASPGLVTLDPVTGKWAAPTNYISLGAGIPSAPVVTNGMIYISNSINANIIIQVPIPGWAIARMKYWREKFF